jgi:hypothetical protein
MKNTFFILFIFFCSISSIAQISVKDSTVAVPIMSASYGYLFSAGDLLKRFGNNSSLQLNIDFKTKKNWLLGINGSFLFGKNVKESLFDSIATSDGLIINKNGEFADVRLYERGFTVSTTIGHMFSFNKPNPNSGVVVNVGVGFIQHKIRIEVDNSNVPQLSKEYKKGYDRLSNGLLLTENIGYLYLSNNRLTNFYFGFECMQGFTKSRRSYDYNLKKRDTQKRLDILYGARLAWVIPLYKKAPQEYYTY